MGNTSLRTDDLIKFSCDLAEKRTDRRPLLLEAVDSITQSSEYLRWEPLGQFGKEPFLVPRRGLPFESAAARFFLDEHSMVVDDRLLVKVNRRGHSFCLTDGLWLADQWVRAYPFTDESDDLVMHIRRNGRTDDVDVIIDPSTGCGHHLFELPTVAHVVGLDVNARAIVFAKINSIIQGHDRWLWAVNDIRDGLPPSLAVLGHQSILVMCNMPFALAPRKIPQPLTSYGGEDALEFTRLAMLAVRTFRQQVDSSRRVRASILAYSLGDLPGRRWQIEAEAGALFSGQFRWSVLGDKKMWRVNGIKAESNPMPLQHLARKADCEITYPTRRAREAERVAYQALSRTLLDRGWTHLGYGVLDLDL